MNLGPKLGFVNHAVCRQLELAVVVDEHKRRPATGSEPLPQLTAFVLDLCETVCPRLFEERRKVGSRGLSTDTYKPDLITKFCFDLCDRRAFTKTRSSPRGPEPYNEVLIGKGRQINRLTGDGCRFSGEDRCIEHHSRAGFGGCIFTLASATGGGNSGDGCQQRHEP